MKINSIEIIHTNDYPQKYIFSPNANLIASSGKNSMGKTSLVRFIIWGMGFDVALTSNFNPADCETSIELYHNDVRKLIRKNGQIEAFFKETSIKYSLPDQEALLMRSLLPMFSDQVREQILGFMYFDQDAGYHDWNRNVVTQRLAKDRSYKISIDALLAELANFDYSNYLKKMKSFENVKEQTKSLNKMIDSIAENLKFSDPKNIKRSIQQISDQISVKQLQLSQVKSKKNLFISGLQDSENFYKLLDKLSIKARVDNKVINIDRENVVVDKVQKVRSTNFLKYYSNQEDKLTKELESLIAQRQIIKSTDDSNDLELISKENSFVRLQQLLSSSGIQSSDSKAVYTDVSAAESRSKAELKNQIKNSDPYSDIWNVIISLGKSVGLSSLINQHHNGLLDRTIKSSGATRSLIIMVYRLGILKYLCAKAGLVLPLILDSPASQEMDSENLTSLLGMIKINFSDFQLIVATNQESSFTFSKNILISNGVLGSLNQE